MSVPERNFIPSSLFFMLILLLFIALPVPVGGQIVVHPYDWVKVGAYAEYIGSIGQSPTIVLPNGTRLLFIRLQFPVVFKWAIVDRQESRIGVNATLFVHGGCRVIDTEHGIDRSAVIAYNKTLSVDVDLYTRESSIDGEPIGKTWFWAEPYQEVGDTITVSSPPSDTIKGEVWWVRTGSLYLGKEIKMYGVDVLQLDPHARASYVFAWYTGVSIEPSLIGPPWEVPPELVGPNFQSGFRNGTRFNITRYAGTLLGTKLGVEPMFGITASINATNIDLTLETEPETFNLWQYLPYTFLATFATTATAFIILRRRKHTIKQKETQKS